MNERVNRRRAVQQLAALPLALSACGGGSSAGPAPPPGPPARTNVLMIAIDDLNDWTGFLGGHSQVRTPAMDALAARSTVFRHAYCNAPVCSPSRASALLGLLPHQTGIYGNNDSWEQNFPEGRPLPKLLAERGLETQVIGKIYHTFELGDQPLPIATPAANLECAGGPATPPYGLFDWGATVDPNVADHPDGRYADAAIDFLGRAHAQPFFLGVGFLRTHVPWYVPQRFFDLYPLASIDLPYVPPDDLDDIPPSGRTVALALSAHDCITRQNLWAEAVQAYLASISFVDEQIGRVIAALDASPHAGNTVVVLWSDHGFHLGEKFHWHKLALWEPATHVPLLVRKPGQQASQSVQRCVSLVDLTPTLLDLLGVAGPDYALAGRSLRPLLDAPDQAWDFPVLTTLQPHDHAIRTDQWRYIRYANGDQELYDTRVDPGEFHNLAGDPSYASVMAELGALMPG